MSAPTTVPELGADARESLAAVGSALVVERMVHYGYDRDEVEAAELPTPHDAFGCFYENWNWVCEDGDGNQNHPLHDEMERTDEFVAWVLTSEVVARLVAEAEQRGREAAAEAIEAEVASEIERLGGEKAVYASQLLVNWVGGIKTAAQVAAESRAGTGGHSGNGARG